MNKEIEKVFTERGFTNIEQMATMFDYYKQEIETHITLNKQLLKDIDRAGKKIKRLQNIIKEVREYIENNNIYSNKKIDDILKILDKGE